MSWLLRRLQAATGVSCPVCLLAAVVTVALAGISFGAVVLDRVRAQQQATLAARGVADIARQRTTDLFVRIDSALNAVSDAIPPGNLTEAGRSQIEQVIGQRRRAEPRLVVLYVLDKTNAVVAGSASAASRSGVVVSACLHDERPDADQVILRSVSLEPPGGGGLRGLCVARGVRRDGFAGTVLAVIGADLLAGQFSDLSVGEHGAVILLDETARPLAWVGSGMPVAVSTFPAPLPDWDAVLRGGGTDPVTGSITEARRIEGPFGAVVAIMIPPEDMLAAWHARTLLVFSSAVIVLMFVALAVIAVRTCEKRERERLDRIAVLTNDICSGLEPQAVVQRMAEEACVLIGCDMLSPEEGGPAPVVDPARPPELTLPRADRVRIGPHVLRKRDGAGFTLADLTFLTVISRIAAIQSGTSGRLADVEETMKELRAAAERYRQTAEAVLLEMPDATFTLDSEWRFVGGNRCSAARDDGAKCPIQVIVGKILRQPLSLLSRWPTR